MFVRINSSQSPPPPPRTTHRFYRPDESPLILFLFGSCCLGDGSFALQHKIGSRVNLLILLGRIPVLNEMYKKAKLIAAFDQKAQEEGDRDLTPQEEDDVARHEQRLDDLILRILPTAP